MTKRAISVILGEASALSGPAGIAHRPQPPYPGDKPLVARPQGEEREEVNIGFAILTNIDRMPEAEFSSHVDLEKFKRSIDEIKRLAKKLIDLHE